MPGFSGSPHPGLSFSFTHLFDEVRKIDSFKNTKPQRISHVFQKTGNRLSSN